MKHAFRIPHLGTIRQWHWFSAAVSLVGMLAFAVSGITLNHATRIVAAPRVTTLEANVPTAVLHGLSAREETGEAPALTPDFRRWLARHHRIHLGAEALPERYDEELYLSLPRPGGDAWLSLDLGTGELLYERTDRGWIAYLNDLHKGRNTGVAWGWFIDLFAIACVAFCVSGLVLLWRQASFRTATWPIVGMGLVLPLLLIIAFVHP